MPKIVNHEQYRKDLLMKSFDLFAQKGFRSTTMRQLAQGLGVSTGTLYHYFPSKEALFWQLIEEQTQQDILNFLSEAGDAQTLPERITALFNFIAKNEDYFSNQILLWYDFCQQQDHTAVLNHESLKRANEQTRQALSDYLGIQDKAIIYLIINLVYGLISTRLFEGATVSFSAQSKLLSEMLTAYLEKQQSRTLVV